MVSNIYLIVGSTQLFLFFLRIIFIVFANKIHSIRILMYSNVLFRFLNFIFFSKTWNWKCYPFIIERVSHVIAYVLKKPSTRLQLVIKSRYPHNKPTSNPHGSPLFVFNRCGFISLPVSEGISGLFVHMILSDTATHVWEQLLMQTSLMPYIDHSTAQTFLLTNLSALQ